MAGTIMRQCVLFSNKTDLTSKICFSTSSQILIKWRYEQGVEPNPNRYGKLTNLPDYSFVNGKPVPLGMNAYKRLKLQESYCKKIVQLSSELDFALERYNKMQEESKLEKQNIIQSKLKPKGKQLLNKEKMSNK